MRGGAAHNAVGATEASQDQGKTILQRAREQLVMTLP